MQVDSTIVGIRGQSFKSEGQGAVWYVNLAVESLLWNMKFQYFSSFLKDENNCVTVNFHPNTGVERIGAKCDYQGKRGRQILPGM